MGRIQKGFALSAAVVGALSILFGISSSICAWVLSTKPELNILKNDHSYAEAKFGNYWWGGVVYIVPGILGIVAGMTRTTVAMVFYLVFNLICLVCSLIVSVLVALLVAFWAIIHVAITDDKCHDVENSCFCPVDGDRFKIKGVQCSKLDNIQTLLGAIIALSCISSLLAFIASYISCCGLCNQEPEYPAVIITPGAGTYQPPNMVVTNSGHMVSAYPSGPAPAFYPPVYSQQDTYPTHDKADLVKNEVI